MCRLPATPTRGRAASLTGWAARDWLIFPQTSSWTASPSCPPTSIINSLAASDPSLDFSQGVKEEDVGGEFFSAEVVNFAEVMEKLYWTAALAVRGGTSSCRVLPIPW